jgi:hypothetical protein
MTYTAEYAIEGVVFLILMYISCRIAWMVICDKLAKQDAIDEEKRREKEEKENERKES